ncbi:MAG TPA: hypothetical protein VFC07_00510 [Verrucomicrobiae bacterium]|nr:hypothetical protein [Verrucomicrobiae bacterium]
METARFSPQINHSDHMAKKRRILAAVLSVVVCLAEQSAHASGAPPKVTLRKKASITVEAQPLVSPQEAESIKQLIRNLAKIDHPDWGLSATFSSSSFAPVAGAEHLDGILMTPGKAKTSVDVVDLVKLGPRAIPFLLEALDDRTPTKLMMKPPMPGMGAMWFADELAGNPAGANEQKVIESRPRLDSLPNHFEADQPEYVGSYTVTVGDVCFVIIGQIVNRPYQATRYQMTGCVVLNSPTHDPALAKEVRDLWSAADPTQHLIDSLLTDFVTEKIDYPGEHFMPTRWIRPSDLQTGAAMRLLYYFPRQSVSMIAEQLRRLDGSKATKDADVPVATADMIEAVKCSNEPLIHAELNRIFEKTTDADALLASVASMGPAGATALNTRMEALIAALPKSEKDPDGEGYTLLYELAEKSGAAAKPVFTRYMQKPSTQRCETLCEVLQDIEGNWTIELLGPLLEDERPVEGQAYADTPRKRGARLPYRVCDEAADVIARRYPKTTFQWTGGYDELDHQIKRMRTQIEQKDF